MLLSIQRSARCPESNLDPGLGLILEVKASMSLRVQNRRVGMAPEPEFRQLVQPSDRLMRPVRCEPMRNESNPDRLKEALRSEKQRISQRLCEVQRRLLVLEGGGEAAQARKDGSHRSVRRRGSAGGKSLN